MSTTHPSSSIPTKNYLKSVVFPMLTLSHGLAILLPLTIYLLQETLLRIPLLPVSFVREMFNLQILTPMELEEVTMKSWQEEPLLILESSINLFLK